MNSQQSKSLQNDARAGVVEPQGRPMLPTAASQPTSYGVSAPTRLPPRPCAVNPAAAQPSGGNGTHREGFRGTS